MKNELHYACVENGHIWASWYDIDKRCWESITLYGYSRTDAIAHLRHEFGLRVPKSALGYGF